MPIFATLDSLAQPVEHNTFNVGVLGSSPRRITTRNHKYFTVNYLWFLLYKNPRPYPRLNK